MAQYPCPCRWVSYRGGPSDLSVERSPRAVRCWSASARQFHQTLRSAEPQALHGSARKGRVAAAHHAKNPRHRIGASEKYGATHTFALLTKGRGKLGLKAHWYRHVQERVHPARHRRRGSSMPDNQPAPRAVVGFLPQAASHANRHGSLWRVLSLS